MPNVKTCYAQLSPASWFRKIRPTSKPVRCWNAFASSVPSSPHKPRSRKTKKYAEA